MDVVSCPHCNNYIIIEQLNCGIFRHGVFISNGENINPHLDEKSCVELFEKKLIYGCGKPFQIIINNNVIDIKKCEYI